MTGFLSSCCKEVCTDSEIQEFKFENFTSSELANVRLVRFPAGNLNTPIDTIGLFMPVNNVPAFRGSVPILLTNDYRVLLNNNATTYTISNIVTRNEDCNCTRGTYKRMVSYRVNGQEKVNDGADRIVIMK